MHIIEKHMISINFGRTDPSILGDRVYLRLNRPEDYFKLYSASSADGVPAQVDLASQIFEAPVSAPSSGLGGSNGGTPGNGGTGGGGGGRIDLPAFNNDTGDKDKKKKKCELEPAEVCVKPSNHEVSAKFELKCEGVPPIVVSTSGEAGVKVGPLECTAAVVK
jgi:hypothetical protein